MVGSRSARPPATLGTRNYNEKRAAIIDTLAKVQTKAAAVYSLTPTNEAIDKAKRDMKTLLDRAVLQAAQLGNYTVMKNLNSQIGILSGICDEIIAAADKITKDIDQLKKNIAIANKKSANEAAAATYEAAHRSGLPPGLLSAAPPSLPSATGSVTVSKYNAAAAVAKAEAVAKAKEAAEWEAKLKQCTNANAAQVGCIISGGRRRRNRKTHRSKKSRKQTRRRR